MYFTSAVGCDSIATLDLTVLQTTSSTSTESVCSSQLPYVWNGNYYSSNGSYIVVLTNSLGCDSSATLNLIVKPTSSSISSASVCSNQLPYVWNGNNYTSTGSYIVVLTNSLGCDSSATLNLIVKPTSSSASSASVCSNQLPYVWNGNNYTSTGSYVVVLTNSLGCDSSATLNLIVKPTSSSISSASVCSNQLPYVWNGNNYTSTGSYVVVLTNSLGCDSSATLNLIVKPTSSSISSASVCSNQLPYVWNGNNYTSTGSYVVVLTNSLGCDSSATLNLIVKPTSSSTSSASVCSNQLPYVWNGNNYTSTGSYVVVLTNSLGCDSSATLNLIVKPTSSSTSSASVCSNQLPYVWNGNNYTSTGSYVVVLTNSLGCDSSATLNLTVNSSLPEPLSLGNQSECEQTPLQTLTATAIVPLGSNIIWYDSLFGGNIVVNPTLNLIGTITYYAESYNGTCSSATRTAISLTINSNPIVGNIIGNKVIPIGQTSQLSNNTAGGTWISSNASVVSIHSTSGLAVTNGIGEILVTYSVTNSFGCTTSVTDTVKVTPLIKPVTESGIVSSATGGIAINNVLSNDSTNGYPSTLINSTISQVGLWPSGITLNTSTGSVTVVPGTTPGTYPITYQLCDKLSPVSCATMLDTVRVTPSIVPVTENGTVPSTGGTAIPNVLSNDYTNGHPSTTTNSTISQVGLWPSGITLNPVTGSVTVVPGTTPGNYPIVYQLCDKLSPVNCATVTDTVKVTPLIKPVTESGIVSSATGGIAINNVLSNDSTNGHPSTLINSTISQVGLWPSGITLNTSTGSVTVVPGTTPGTYPITYQLCDKLSPVSCATMLDTVRVTPSIVPVTENGTVPSTGGTAINNVLSNDYTNGHPSTTTNSTISQVGLWPSGITLNPSTGSVTVVPGTTPGNYPIVYQLCDKLSPVNCATVTDTVKVTPLIKPVTESGIVSSATGGIAINNVLSNDSTNGYPSTLINSTISQVGLWPSGITLNTSTGSVTVVPGTTPGTYPITYQLCDKLSPVSCATMLDTVRVTPSIVPVTENGTVPSTGGTAINNVLSNDYTNGHPSTTTNSTISQVGLWPSGITLNPSTGSVTVVPGTTPGNYPIVYQLCDKLSPVNCATMLDSVRVTPYVGPITGQDHVCVGSTITLSNITTGGVWASNNTAVATVNTSTGVVTGVTPGTTTINYTVTINSVSTTQTKVVTVYANPLVNAISGLSSLCENNTIVLGSSPAGGVWSSNNTAVATVNSSTGVVTAISAGVATISYAVTNVNGCMSTVIKNITVYANPVVGQIGGNPNVCVGKTTLLSNTASGGVWSSNNMSVAIINSSTGVVTGLSAGVAMISYSVTNSNNCNTTVTQVVNVYTSPLVSSILGVSSVCVNNVTILSSSPSGGVWSSSNTLVATVDVVTGHVLGIAAGTSVISYTVTNGGVCSKTVTKDIIVNTNPVSVSPILGTLSICVNCVRNLSNATSGGVWSSSNTSIATVNINGQVTGIAAGTTSISYTVTSSNGCSITESVLFTVYPNPIVSPITGNPVTCVGSTTQLTSSPAGGAWSSNNTSVATIDAVSGLVTGVFGGTALIGYTVSDVNGCITTVTQLVTVNVGPLVSPIMGTGNICVAQTTVLSNSTSGGIWTSSNTAVATINSSGVVTGLSAGSAIISYTVTGSNGCSTSSTKTVNVYAYPVVDPITGYSSVCSGGSIVLSSSPSGGVWSSNNAGIATVNSATGVVTGVSAGSAIISYTVTNANGCSTIVSRVVTVNGKPVVDPIAGNASICVGNTTTLSNTTPAGTWSSSNTGVATINNSGLVTAISAGTTTITYTIVDGNGCVGTATQVVTVYANPVLGSISGTSGVCVGKTTLLINGSSGGVWSSSNTAVATIHATTGQVTGIAAGTSTISYTVTSSHGCSTTVNYTVTVYSNPLVDPIAGKSSTCVGGSVTFSSNTVGGVWSSSDTSVAMINSNTGVLTGVSSGNCGDQAIQ